MVPHSIRCTLFFSLLATLANAQTQLPPRDVTVAARRVLTHDIGGFWPGTFINHIDGTVTALGNVWLGGGMHPLPLLTGIVDMARIDAQTPGASETVAMVGSDGLTMVRCDAADHSYAMTPWTDPLLLDAKAVRTTPMTPQPLVAVLTADGQTVRSYRQGGAFLSSFTMPAPVLDFEAFRHASGTVRMLVLTSAGLSCRLLNGTLQWTVDGTGGDIVRWPNHPTIKAAWMHRDPATNGWRIALLGDEGVLRLDALGSAFAASEQLVAAFAVDGDADGDADWLVKTTTGSSVLINGGTNEFVQPVEVQVGEAQSLEPTMCIPDTFITHGGRRVRLIDEQSPGTIGWQNLHLFVGGGSDWIDGISLPAGGVILDHSNLQSKIDFQVDIAPEWLDAFVVQGLTTYVQLLAWRQAEPIPGGRPDDTAYPNDLFHLNGIPSPINATTRWPLDATIDLPFPDGGWDAPEHYWLTIRLVTTDAELNLVSASEPITLCTTLCSAVVAECEFLLGYCAPGTLPASLPRVICPPDAGTHGGTGVVGVITQIVVPPPPPTSGIPAPGPTTAVKESNLVTPGP